MNSISNLQPAASSRAFKAWRPHCARALERVARCMRREAEAIYYCFVLHFSSRNTVLNIRTAPAELVPSLCTCSVPFPSIVSTAACQGWARGWGCCCQLAAGSTCTFCTPLQSLPFARAGSSRTSKNGTKHLESDAPTLEWRSCSLRSSWLGPSPCF